MKRMRFNGKEVIIDSVIRGETLIINDLMIERQRDGEVDEIRAILEKLIDKVEPERVLYHALTREEVLVYTEVGFDVCKEDGDPEFPHKCVMEYIC